MITRVATIALALCCCAAAAASRPFNQQLRRPKRIAKPRERPQGLAKRDVVRLTDIEPSTANSTAWLVAYQFNSPSFPTKCDTPPLSAAKLAAKKCLLEHDPEGEGYSSYQYVCGHDFGAGMLTYSGTECESETFLGFVEFAPASELDQCVDAFYDDIPEIVNDMYMFVDGQIWQCTDDDGIGYDLSNQPTHAQYDKNCKNGLRTIAYLREQECFMHDDSYDPLDRSYSLTCKKKLRFTYYDDATCTDVDWDDAEDAKMCVDWTDMTTGDKWTEVVRCGGDNQPGSDDDAATVASAGSLGMFASVLLLLFGMANQM